MPPDQAAEAKAARAKEIRDCAMLLYSPGDAALALEMSLEEFNALLNDPAYGDAWANGRLTVKTSLYAALLKAARIDQSVPAIKLALQLAQDNPAMAEATIAQANEATVGEPADSPMKITPATFESKFRDAFVKRRGGEAAG